MMVCVTGTDDEGDDLRWFRPDEPYRGGVDVSHGPGLGFRESKLPVEFGRLLPHEGGVEVGDRDVAVVPVGGLQALVEGVLAEEGVARHCKNCSARS